MSILEKLTLPEIRELIEVEDRETLREIVNDWMPEDIADLLDDLSPEEDMIVLESLDPEKAARAFEHIAPSARAALPSFSDPDWMEERVETDAPVSRTRHSAMPMASWARRATNFAWSLRRAVLTRTGAMAVVNNLRQQPKHNLVLLAIGSGILLGVTLTLIFAAPDDAPVAAVPLGSAKVAQQPATPTPPVPMEPPSAQNASSAKPPSSAPLTPTVTAVPKTLRVEESEPRRKAPAPRKRSTPRAPDYGI